MKLVQDERFKMRTKEGLTGSASIVYVRGGGKDSHLGTCGCLCVCVDSQKVISSSGSSEEEEEVEEMNFGGVLQMTDVPME